MANWDLDKVNDYLKPIGYRCVSENYKNTREKLEFRCENGHRWFTTFRNFTENEARCSACKRNKKLEEAQRIAITNGGKCLSKEYINQNQNLEWQCKEGHKWIAKFGNVKHRHSWCPKCSKTSPIVIEDLIEIAEKRNGTLLSKEIKNNKSKLLWKCANGHSWKATPNSIKRGSWCPRCYFFYSEQVCRSIFETIFQNKFPKTRPSWLVNPKTNNRLELDGYCEELNLAFEFQGVHHFKAIYGEKSISEVKQRDYLKAMICEKMNVILIKINYDCDLYRIPEIIEEKCKKTGFDTKNFNFRKKIKIDFFGYDNSKLESLQKLASSKGGKLISNIYVNNKSKLKWKCQEGHIWEANSNNVQNGSWCPVCTSHVPLQLSDLQSIARKRGGKLLSTDYHNSKSKLIWQCKKGHTWKATAGNIKNKKQWCLTCSGHGRKTIEDMHFLAEKYGGKCLSSKYVSNKLKLTWMCKIGHIWDAKPNDVQQGHWCYICARNKTKNRNFLSVIKIAEEKGGKCLSTEYQNSYTKLSWQCKIGHVWESDAHSIKKGYWCPKCSGNLKLTINEMHEIAASRNGKCLSTEYYNSYTKLTWQCEQGHTWMSKPNTIKNGNWCPTCGMESRIRKLRAFKKK